MAFIPPHPPIDLRPATVSAEVAFGSRYAAAHGGLLPSDPWWATMIGREDQSIALGFHENFARNHQYAIDLLDRNYALTHQTRRPTQPSVVVPPIFHEPKPERDDCNPVPEPPALISFAVGGLILIGACLISKIRKLKNF